MPNVYFEDRVPITRAEAAAAGDFSKPVEISGRLWWIKESPIFSIGHNVAWVLAESAAPAVTILE